MRRKLAVSVLVSLVLLACVSCAGLQEKWKGATEDERARILLGTFQQTLDMALDGGIIYVNAHPEKRPEWKAKVLPMFDTTNKMIRDFMVTGAAGGKPLTVMSVTMALAARIGEIQAILIGWGVKLSMDVPVTIDGKVVCYLTERRNVL